MDVSLESSGSLKGDHRRQPPDTHINTRARGPANTRRIWPLFISECQENAVRALEWNILHKHGKASSVL